jgi:glycosyltransferase involved in cell wall biosynthesis
MRIVLTRRERLDSPDGVSIFIVALAQALTELDHEVRVVVGSMESRELYQRLLSPRIEFPILALSREPLSGIASAAAWLRGKAAIDQFDPDLVIHNEAVPLPMRGKIVHVVHDLQPRSGRLAPLWRTIRRYSARRSDQVIATTTELRDELVRDLGLDEDEIVIIPKCIDRAAYQRPNITLRERAIFHAGTLPYKDPAATVRAFGVLADPSVALYIAGEVTEETRVAVDALPDQLRARVTLLGAAEGQAVRDLHARVRVASFPTSYQIPVASATVMEAVAAGTPVVGSSRISRDLLVDRLNGLVADTAPDALAAALRTVLDDDVLWRRLSAGAARMAERFDAIRIAGRYIELARSMTSR